MQYVDTLTHYHARSDGYLCLHALSMLLAEFAGGGNLALPWIVPKKRSMFVVDYCMNDYCMNDYCIRREASSHSPFKCC